MIMVIIMMVIDVIRPEAKAAVDKINRLLGPSSAAGPTVTVLTGDSQEVANQVCNTTICLLYHTYNRL